MNPYLNTQRLALRPLELSDADQLASVYSHKALARMSGSIPHPFAPMAAEFRIMKARAGRERGISYPYVVTLKQDGLTPNDAPLMGDVELFTNGDGDWEIGYGLDKSLWGQGLATEAARAVLGEADKTLGAPVIKAGHFDDNPASGRILQKLGFIATGKTDFVFSMARLHKASGVTYSRPSQASLSSTPIYHAKAS